MPPLRAIGRGRPRKRRPGDPRASDCEIARRVKVSDKDRSEVGGPNGQNAQIDHHPIERAKAVDNANPLVRTWEWSPKTDTVSYEGKDKEGKLVKASYQRSQLSSQSDGIKNEIDPDFANDHYWLLLPFHVVWDGATVTDEGMQKLPPR